MDDIMFSYHGTSGQIALEKIRLQDSHSKLLSVVQYVASESEAHNGEN